MELCQALAIQPGDKAPNSDKVYDVEDVISVYAGLVTVDEESDIIRLAHPTTQEYFDCVLSKWYPSAQEEIAVAYLTYLSFDTFRSGSCTSREVFEQNALLNYSAHYWSEHIRPVEESTSHLALAFLCDEALVDSIIQAVSMPNQTRGLHLTARYGRLYLTERLLNTGADSKDDYGRTPLALAAEEGHEAVAKLLLATGNVDVDSKDSTGWTALLWAARNGHETVVKLLLSRSGVDADSRDPGGRTPLSHAVERGHKAVGKLLVERDDVEADSKDNWGRTPLWYASEQGHKVVVKLLVEREDVNADSRDKLGRTPLWYAAERGHELVVKLLAERDDVNADSTEAAKENYRLLYDSTIEPPVKFKDAIGRKFSFPWYLCKTWRGMEELIKQTFFAVDTMGSTSINASTTLLGLTTKLFTLRLGRLWLNRAGRSQCSCGQFPREPKWHQSQILPACLDEQ
jgi:ankyrin repeat protein